MQRKRRLLVANERLDDIYGIVRLKPTERGVCSKNDVSATISNIFADIRVSDVSIVSVKLTYSVIVGVTGKIE